MTSSERLCAFRYFLVDAGSSSAATATAIEIVAINAIAVAVVSLAKGFINQLSDLFPVLPPYREDFAIVLLIGLGKTLPDDLIGIRHEFFLLKRLVGRRRAIGDILRELSLAAQHPVHPDAGR